MFSDKYRLLTPGPVQIPDSVLKELAQPMIHHRTPQFTEIFKNTLKNLKYVFQTQQPVMSLTTTGSGAMEAAIVNSLSPQDEALFICSGKFGERWASMAQAYAVQTHILKVNWGEELKINEVKDLLKSHPNIKAIFTQSCETSTCVLHNIKELAKLTKNNDNLILVVDAISSLLAAKLPMDEWGIDILIAGSQKSFMLPAGLSFISLSAKAWEYNKASTCPKFYLDIKKELNANSKNMTHFSSGVSLIRALNISLEQIKAKGLEHYHTRCQLLQNLTLQALNDFKLKTLSSCPVATAIFVPDDIDGAKLRLHIEKKYNLSFMGGQDHLKGKIIRVGHIGHISNEDFLASIYFLGKSLIDFNYNGLGEKELLRLIAKLKDQL